MMTSARTTIFKNAGALMASQIATWALALLLTVFLPRYLGAAAVGQLQLGIALWSLMSVLVTFGMDTLLAKEIARHPSSTPELLITSFALRGLLYILSFGAVALYLHLLDYPAITVNVVYLIGIAQLIWLLAGATQAALQGLEVMEYVSIANVAAKAINTILGIAALLMGYRLYAVVIVSIVAALVNLLLQLVFLGRRQLLRAWPRMDRAGAMLKASSPYLLTGLTLVGYNQADTLIMSSLVSTTMLGWYAGAMRLYGSLMFLPVVFTTSIFPMLARTHASSPDTLPRLARRSFDLLLLLGVPIGLGLLVLADPLVALLYGPQFAPSGPILAVMGVVLICMYQNVLLGQFLISTDRQNAWSIVMVVAAAVTVPLDLALVPWCERQFGNGGLGGALSFTITELGMLIAGVVLLPHGTLGWSNIRVALRVIGAGLAMAGAAWLCRDLFLAVPIVVGAITYSGLIVAFRVVPKEELALLMALIRRAIAPLRRRAAPEQAGSTGV